MSDDVTNILVGMTDEGVTLGFDVPIEMLILTPDLADDIARRLKSYAKKYRKKFPKVLVDAPEKDKPAGTDPGSVFFLDKDEWVVVGRPELSGDDVWGQICVRKSDASRTMFEMDDVREMVKASLS